LFDLAKYSSRVSQSSGSGGKELAGDSRLGRRRAGEGPSGYWNYLSFQLQRLEAQWLAQQSPAAGANFAPANPEKPKRDEMMLMKFP
jgi:hypothetical protein